MRISFYKSTSEQTREQTSEQTSEQSGDKNRFDAISDWVCSLLYFGGIPEGGNLEKSYVNTHNFGNYFLGGSSFNKCFGFFKVFFEILCLFFFLAFFLAFFFAFG